MKVLCLLADGFETGEALVPVDVLRRGKQEVVMAAIGDKKVISSHKVAVEADCLLCETDYKDFDCLFLPGGAGHKLLEASEEVRDIIHYFEKEHKYIATICASGAILGRMGILKGKHYTCFPDENGEFGGTYHKQYAVRDDNIITGMSLAAALDFGLLLLETLSGKDTAEEVKARIYYQ